MPQPTSASQILYTTGRTDAKLTIPSTANRPLGKCFQEHPVYLLKFGWGSMVCSAIGISYNLPKFCPSATWDPYGITWANESLLGTYIRVAFVDSNNTIYISSWTTGHIYIWLDGNINRKTNLSVTTTYTQSLFVTTAGDIFVDHGSSQVVDKLTSNGTKTTEMQVSDSCYGLFVAINHDIYCSLNALHQIVKKSVVSDIDDVSIIAGTGCYGSSSATLSGPQGIFVDRNLGLYVADTNNNRIQFFPFDQKNGTTLVGGRSNISIALSRPTSIILDGDGSLFIADSGNRRIVTSGSNGSRCIVGCSGSMGGGANPLWRPWNMNFDRDGNIFVIDVDNNRMQKFLLAKNSCGKHFDIVTHRRSCSEACIVLAFHWTLLWILAIANPINIVVPTLHSSPFIAGRSNIFMDACQLSQPCPSHATCINSSTLPRATSASVHQDSMALRVSSIIDLVKTTPAGMEVLVWTFRAVISSACAWLGGVEGNVRGSWTIARMWHVRMAVFVVDCFVITSVSVWVRVIRVATARPLQRVWSPDKHWTGRWATLLRCSYS